MNTARPRVRTGPRPRPPPSRDLEAPGQASATEGGGDVTWSPESPGGGGRGSGGPLDRGNSSVGSLGYSCSRSCRSSRLEPPED